MDAVAARAPRIEVWGTGAASREFLFVEDCARAIVLATENYDKPEPVNLGAGREITIRELVRLIATERHRLPEKTLEIDSLTCVSRSRTM